jgi:dihydroorotate dehydrogenase
MRPRVALVQKLLFRLEPERAHALTLTLLPWLVAFSTPKPPRRLAIDVFGLRFPSPIGIAAGFDKNAEVPDALLKLGFGFAEVGTITPKPQSGNPQPRIFRLVEDAAVINRLGFNNQGLDHARLRMAARQKLPGIVGANVGANKDSIDRIADYETGIRSMLGLASYVTINISSPNTPGLRALQSRDHLDELVQRCQAARGDDPTPLIVKLAPDLTDEDANDIAEIATMRHIDGLIVSNTTISRPSGLRSAAATETGGLSGAPLFRLSTEKLRQMRRLTRGQIPLIGVGGVSTGAQAYAKIKAGASLIQLYTGLIYQGPGLIKALHSELEALLVQDGFNSLSEAVGVDA